MTSWCYYDYFILFINDYFDVFLFNQIYQRTFICLTYVALLFRKSHKSSMGSLKFYVAHTKLTNLLMQQTLLVLFVLFLILKPLTDTF